MKYILILLLSMPMFLAAQGETVPSKDIQNLISRIKGKNIVYGKFVGFAGSTPGEFLAFEKFVQTASLDEMKFYLNDQDASIRAYAFWAISVKHPGVAKNLIKELPADPAKISTMLGGCIMEMETVENFRTQMLTAPSNYLFSADKKNSPKPSTSLDY